MRVVEGPGGVKIRVRGPSSFSGGQDPLFVVDGVAVEPTATGELPGRTLNDIAGIEVLKDASETALYGSRGTNGVVVVTAKRDRAD